MKPLLDDVWNDSLVLRDLNAMGGEIGGPIVVQPGYWRWNNATRNLYECPGGAAACGAETLSSSRNVIGTGTCGAGHEGNLCQSCEPQHAADAEGVCQTCNNAGNLAGVILFCLVGFVLVVFGYWFLLWRPLTPGMNQKFNRTLTKVHSTLSRSKSAVAPARPSPPPPPPPVPMDDVVGGDSTTKPTLSPMISMRLAGGLGKNKWTKGGKSKVRSGMMKTKDLKATAKNALEDFDAGLMTTEEFVEMSRAIVKALEQRKRLIVAFLKIIVTFYQIMSSMPFILNSVPWPSDFTRISSAMSFINLDIVKIPSLSCLAPGGRFFSRLLLYVFGPFLVFLGLIGTGVLGSVFFKNHPKLEEFHDGIYYNLNLFLFLVYPVVSATTFSTFACADVDGTWLLKADYEVECFKGVHAGQYTVLGIIGIMLYPIGIPLFTALVLVKDGILEVARCRLEEETQKEIILQAVLEAVTPWDVHWKMEDGVLSFADLSDAQLKTIHDAFVKNDDGAKNDDENNDDAGDGEEDEFVKSKRAQGEGGGGGGGAEARDAMEVALMDWARNEGARKITVGEVSFMSHDDAAYELKDSQKLERSLVKRHGLIFSSYHTGAPFFELFEMFRKLLLTSILQFVAPGSATQLTFATLVNFTALCVSFNWSPFLDNSVDAFNQVSLVQLFLTTFSALLLFVQPSGSADTLYFNVLLIACQFGLPAFPVVVKLWQAAGEGVDVILATGVAKGVKHLFGDLIADVSKTLMEVKEKTKSLVMDNAAVSSATGFVGDVRERVTDLKDQVQGAVDDVKAEVQGAVDGVKAEIEDLKSQAMTGADAATGGALSAAENAAATASEAKDALVEDVDEITRLANEIEGISEKVVNSAAAGSAAAVGSKAMNTGIGKSATAAYDQAVNIKDQAEEMKRRAEEQIANVKRRVEGVKSAAESKVIEAKQKLEAIRARLEHFLWETWPGRVAGVLINYTRDHPKVRRAVVRELDISSEAMTFVTDLTDSAKRHSERLAAKKARGGGDGGARHTDEEQGGKLSP